MIDREPAVIIKCAPDHGPGVWTIIASSLIRGWPGWVFINFNPNTSLVSPTTQQVPFPSTKQGRKGRDNDLCMLTYLS